MGLRSEAPLFDVLERRQLSPAQQKRAFELIQEVDPSIHPHLNGDLLALIHHDSGSVLSVHFFDRRNLWVAKTDKTTASRPLLKAAAEGLGRTPARELLLHVRDYLIDRHPGSSDLRFVDTNAQGEALLRHAQSAGARVRESEGRITLIDLKSLQGAPAARPKWSRA